MEMLDDLADGLSTGMTPELIDEKWHPCHARRQSKEITDCLHRRWTS